MYEGLEEWINSNTSKAYKIAEKLEGKDKEDLLKILDWMKHQIIERQILMKLENDATKEICSIEQYMQIQELLMAYQQNDFVINNPWGREMYEKGHIQAASTKIIIFPEEEDKE